MIEEKEENLSKVSVQLRKPQDDWLERKCKEKGLMKSEIIRGLISAEMGRDYLDRITNRT